MSGSRQHFTGNLSIFFLFWIVLVMVVWWLPTLLTTWFPESLVYQKEPWLMSPDDLNWKRALFNVITKPGFRVVTAIVLGLMCGGVRQFLLWIYKGKRLSIPLRGSGEWVMEGRMQSNLLEYGRWVGVVH